VWIRGSSVGWIRKGERKVKLTFSLKREGATVSGVYQSTGKPMNRDYKPVCAVKLPEELSVRAS
jgi:hypothetical protein